MAAASAVLSQFATGASTYPHCWPDAVNLTTEAILNPVRLLGHRQLTDAYLLTLAVHNGGQFVALDGLMFCSSPAPRAKAASMLNSRATNFERTKF